MVIRGSIENFSRKRICKIEWKEGDLELVLVVDVVVQAERTSARNEWVGQWTTTPLNKGHIGGRL